MIDPELVALGARVAELRIARRLKQAELAYEAGVSHRTLQRLEAGEVVRSDSLSRVLKCLGRWDVVLDALQPEAFSPYARLADAGLKVSDLEKQRKARAPLAAAPVPAARKRRVRRSSKDNARAEGEPGRRTVAVQWPEDRQ
jgi:transcriptional regulator with XRE-family HTH domain